MMHFGTVIPDGRKARFVDPGATDCAVPEKKQGGQQHRCYTDYQRFLAMNPTSALAPRPEI